MAAAVGLALGWSGLPTLGAGAEAAFDEAARLYEQRRFAESAAAYERLVKEGTVTVSVLFNQGNAWLQAGKLGRAIASYRTARALAPRDEEVHAGLRLARSRVAAAGRTTERLETRWLGWLRAREWAVLAVAVSSVAGLVLLVREFRPRARAMGRGAVSTLAGLALALVGLAFWSGRLERTASVVVVVPEASARFGPLEEAQAAFVIPDGTELTVLDRKGSWFEVRDPGGRRGWIAEGQVGVVGGGG